MVNGSLEAMLRRDRLVVAGALGVIAALAWAYVLWLAVGMNRDMSIEAYAMGIMGRARRRRRLYCRGSVDDSPDPVVGCET